MNYKIIKNEERLREFIHWLPELQETEKYYLCLFARSKYTRDEAGKNGIPHLKTDKSQLRRIVSDKERLFKKIKQLEIEEGAWFQKEIPIPQSALALYINPNPRDLWKATFNSLIKLANCIRDQNKLVNPYAEALSEIQKAKSRTCFIDFDVDEEDMTKLTNTVMRVFDVVNIDAVTVLQTRGGAHILVEPHKVLHKYRNTFYKDIFLVTNADGDPDKPEEEEGDRMIPVPGCTQGGFEPYFLDLNVNHNYNI